MRLIALMTTVVFLNTHAAGMAQTVTISGEKMPLKKVFSAVERQTGYFVFYDAELLNTSGPVTINVTDMPLQRFLDNIVKDEPFTYRIVKKTIFLSWKEPVALPTTIPEEQPVSGPITGTVRGFDGKPLSGVSVMIKKTKKGTSTAKDGTFKINAEPGDILVISSIGFLSREIIIDQQKTLGDIRLKNFVGELDQSVVIGYGTTSRRLNTGSVTTVTAQDLEKQPVLNPLLALRGLVPGLVVTPTGGYASSPVKMLVRGRNNISDFVSSDPLILIDGMPITTLNLDGSDQTNGANILPNLQRYQIGESPTGGESPLFGLNPKDIESITVLKDADATAIYGSRGANGVILITTKKAKAHASEFNINVSQGISKVTRRYKMMNTTQYLDMRRQALKNDGVGYTAENAPDLLLWDTTRNTNWQNALWGGTGQVTNVTAGLSGGSNNSSFRLNGNYARQTEILTISGGSQAANLAFNLSHHTPDQKFSVDFASVYTHGSTKEVNQFGLASTLPPDAPPIYNSNGALNYAEWDADAFQLFGQFPFGGLLQVSKSSTNTSNSNLSLNYKPLKGLEFRASIGYRTTVNNSQSFNPIIAQDPTYNPKGSALFTTTSSGGWIIEPQINYSNPAIGPGKLGLLLGASVQSSDSRYNVEQGTNYTNDELLNSIINAPTQAAYDAYGQYKYAGIFARINYDIANKYVINLNGRRDGSSRFGPGFQFGNFGSVAGAWVLSEEKWLRPLLPAFISFLKLRASYGITGSDGVPEFQYLSQWAAGSGNSLMPSYNGVQRPITSLHAVNQYFHWQGNKQLTEALEMDFLPDSRMTLTIEHYRNRCSNQLLQFPTALFTGFNNVTANWNATVQNSGYEASVTASILADKELKWTIGGNISFNTNKLQKYDDIANSPYFSKLLVGKSLNAQYLYHYIGVDPLTGLYTFQDYNHDGVITQTGSNYAPLSNNVDNNHVMNLNPKFTGGFTTQFSYKGLSLALLFDFVSQIGKNAYADGYIPGTMLENQPAELVNNHWQKPGDNAKYMRYTVGTQQEPLTSSILFGASDGVYTDASFLRLANLSISYNLPEKTAKKIKMRGCNMYLNAQNLYTFTKYKGTDPELQSFGAMPQAKVITGGISFNF